MSLTPEERKKHLETLGLGSNASNKDIKTAYRKLSLKYHPDKKNSSEAEAIFLKLAPAYNALMGKDDPTVAESSEAANTYSSGQFVKEKISKFDIKIVNKYIENDDVNHILEDGDSLFIKAVKSFKMDCINALMKQAKLDVNFQDKQGDSAITILAGYPNAKTTTNDLIKKLHKKGAILDIESKDGSTPLMKAIIANNVELVEFLLQKNADIESMTTQGYTPLDIAHKNNVSSEIIILLEAAQEKLFLANNDVFSLVYTYKKVTVDQVKKWLANGIDKNAIIDADDQTSLLTHYIKQENVPVAEFLINNGAKLGSVDKKGNTPLLLAATIQDKTIANKLIDLLLKKHANIDAQNEMGYTALMYAAESKNADLIDLLLANKASISLLSKSGKTAKDFAISTKLGKDSIAKLEANEEGEFIANNNLDGLLSKHKTISFKELEELVKKDFDINAEGKGGMTLLKLFIQKSDVEAVKFLVNNEASLDHKDSDGNTALMLSIKANSQPIAEILINRQANLDTQNNNGETALIIASKLGFNNLITLLTSHGASSTIESHEGKTAAVYATEANSKAWFKSDAPDTLKKSGEAEYIEKGDLTKLMKDKKEDISFEQAKTWLEQGLDVNSEGKNKLSLLTHFAAKNDPTAITFLVNKKADVNHQDSTGKTALHILSLIKGNVAVAWGYTAPDNTAAKFLIDSHQADLCLKDRAGNRVYENAVANGNTDLVRYIDATGFITAVNCGELPPIDSEL